MGDLERQFPYAYGVVQSHVTKKDKKRPLKIIRGVVPEEDKKQEAIDKKQEAIDWENRFIKQQYIEWIDAGYIEWIEWIDARLVVKESHRRQTQKERMSDIRHILEKFLIIIKKLEDVIGKLGFDKYDKSPNDLTTFLSKIKSNVPYGNLYSQGELISLSRSDGENYTNTFQVLYDFIYEFSPILRKKYHLTPREYTLEGNPVEDDSTCTGASCGGLFDWFRKGGTRRKIKKNKSKKRKSKKRRNRIR
jgi:hypothetical protein